MNYILFEIKSVYEELLVDSQPVGSWQMLWQRATAGASPVAAMFTNLYDHSSSRIYSAVITSSHHSLYIWLPVVLLLVLHMVIVETMVGE